jgi:hypothetical protein
MVGFCRFLRMPALRQKPPTSRTFAAPDPLLKNPSFVHHVPRGIRRPESTRLISHVNGTYVVDCVEKGGFERRSA